MRQVGMLALLMCLMLAGYGGMCGGDGGGNPTGSSAYDISGRVTLNGAAFPGVTISLSGAVSVATVTDANGNYVFTGLANGNYILAPSKAGYTFNPASSVPVTLNGVSMLNQNFTGTLVDTTAPSIPANLIVSGGSSAGEVLLSWSPSTDNVAVAGYYVLRDSVTIATTTATAYTDTIVLQSTAYSYTVTAFDGAGNVSSPSSPAFSPVIGSGGGGGIGELLTGFSGNLNQAGGAVFDNNNMDWGSDIAVDSATAGGPYIYALGAAFTATNAAGNCVIAKFNSAGNILATAKFDGTGGSALALNQNGVYVTGQRSTPSAYVAIKYDLDLNLITSTALAGDARARDIALDNSGNVYVIGSGLHSPTTVGNEYDYKIVKYDADLVQQGNPIIYDSGWRDEGSGIDLDNAGNIYVTGVKIIASTNTIVTVKYNPAWAPQNTAEYGASVYADTNKGLFPKIAVDRNSGNVFIAGTVGGQLGRATRPGISYSSGIVPAWPRLLTSTIRTGWSALIWALTHPATSISSATITTALSRTPGWWSNITPRWCSRRF